MEPGQVGREIRRIRKAKGLSQTKVAAAADMGPSGLSQIETGARNPSAVTLDKIATALGVEVADLFPKAQAPLSFEESADAGSTERRYLRGGQVTTGGTTYDMWSSGPDEPPIALPEASANPAKTGVAAAEALAACAEGLARLAARPNLSRDERAALIAETVGRSETALERHLKEGEVFARLTPEAKRHAVRAWHFFEEASQEASRELNREDREANPKQSTAGWK